MTSYHLTSFDNWSAIRSAGMVPYPIANDGVQDLMQLHLGHNLGTWVWAERPRGDNLLGTVLDRVMHKHATRVVMLSIEHGAADVFDPSPPGETWMFVHNGAMSHERNPKPWVYHERAIYRILLGPIPPERIALLADWDLIRLLEGRTRGAWADAIRRIRYRLTNWSYRVEWCRRIEAEVSRTV